MSLPLETSQSLIIQMQDKDPERPSDFSRVSQPFDGAVTRALNCNPTSKTCSGTGDSVTTDCFWLLFLVWPKMSCVALAFSPSGVHAPSFENWGEVVLDEGDASRFHWALNFKALSQRC